MLDDDMQEDELEDAALDEDEEDLDDDAVFGEEDDLEDEESDDML